jgi:hypothetical protein
LTDDVLVESIAAGTLDAPVAPPASLSLERMEVSAGAILQPRQVTTAEILYVEAGALTLVDSLGLTSTLTEDSGVYLRAGAVYETRNDGNESTSVLRLVFTGAVDSATPTASPMATPVTGSGADDVIVTSLGDFSLPTLPEAPITFFLNRATWEPGIDSGQYVQHGPIGVLVQSGTLTISSPYGIDGNLG